MGYREWKPYVPVAKRRAQAKTKMDKLRKKGIDIRPVEIEGRKIAKTFWGKGWCDHLESFSDYENRLPRGRTYVRNGSVCHLDISKGKIDAMVNGSDLYKVKITIETLSARKWSAVKRRSSGQIGSLLELLQGKLSENVMSVVTDRKTGLFPRPGEIELQCSCPDWAVMCKHVAAVLYGVGARLDESPELLFLLRGVDHQELIGAEVDAVAAIKSGTSTRRRIADSAVSDVFGIEIFEDETPDTVNSVTDVSRKKPKSGSALKTAGKSAGAGKAQKPGQPANSANIPVRHTQKGRPISGKTVATLRAKFDMTQGEFSRLLGVSASSIGTWEKTSGSLGLRDRTRDALVEAKKLTKREARRKLDKM
jgi:uncharacterized Zn finger protein